MAAVNAGDPMGVAVEVSSLEFNAEDEEIFRIIPISFFLQIMSSTTLVTRELLKPPIWALELLKSWIYCIWIDYELLTNWLNFKSTVQYGTVVYGTVRYGTGTIIFYSF